MRGRIIKGLGGLYEVSAENEDGGIIFAKPRGVFRNRDIKPFIGDICEIGEITRGAGKTPDNPAVIAEILPRKNLLPRPPAANIDNILIVADVSRIESEMPLLTRRLVYFESIARKAGNIRILIAATKRDLVTRAEDYEKRGLREFFDLYESRRYYRKYWTSMTAGRLRAVKSRYAARLYGRTTLLAGSSGAGKSTLVNALTGTERAETGEVGKGSRGRQTTRHVELIPLPLGKTAGSFILDTPGFSSVDLSGVTRGELPGLFPEFRPFLGKCGFRDCRHVNEPGCAVREKVAYSVTDAHISRANGEISTERYESYLKLYEQLQ
ncbi:MAG: ribosome small subunit-dependent GTPase A [Clostridiales bacterium]|jgi:ribosome biogenesis GTPase|nr:ribosome small subunit-dependent GTPase A [Clostridiales bacterium]